MRSSFALARVAHPYGGDRHGRLTRNVDAVCLLLGGVVRTVLPATEFSLEWDHSVEKSRWEEHYRIEGGQLRLTDARVRSMGAGMEPPPDAQLQNGWWRWQVTREPLPELRLTFSTYTADYRICWNERCSNLADAVSESPRNGDVITVLPCTSSGVDLPPGAAYAAPVRSGLTGCVDRSR